MTIYVSSTSLLPQRQSGVFPSFLLLVTMSFQDVPMVIVFVPISPPSSGFPTTLPKGNKRNDMIRCYAFSESGCSATSLGLHLICTFLSLIGHFCKKSPSVCVNFSCVCGSHRLLYYPAIPQSAFSNLLKIIAEFF